MNPASNRRQLWTGPCGTDRLGPLIAQQGWNRWACWIVPSEPARADLARRLDPAATPLPRIWTWPDLWDAVAERSESPPARLAPAAQRAFLAESIDRARGSGDLPRCEKVADTPGFRRQVAARITGWTRAERDPEGDTPPEDPIDREQWSIYRQYRAILAGLDSEDAEGFAAWASRELAESSRSHWPDLDAAIFAEALDWNAPRRRALDWLRSEIRFVAATLPYDGDPALGEAYRIAADVRSALIDRGFAEHPIPLDPERPAGLVTFAREIFRPDALAMPPATDAAGLALAGVPRGEAEGHFAARKIKDALDAGIPPGRILLLARRWNEETDAATRAIASWRLPIRVLRPRPLRSAPAASALRLAMAIPAHGWDASDIANFLRHQLVRPPDRSAPADPQRIAAAQAILESRAFRERDLIRAALARHAKIVTERPDLPGGWALQRKAHRAKAGIVVLDWLAAVLAPWGDGPKTFPGHADALFEVAAALGLGATPEDREALDALRTGLEDHDAAREALGKGDDPLEFAAFAAEVESLSRDLALDPPGPGDGDAVVFTTLDRAEGVRARRAILLGLTEGTFPLTDAADFAPEEAAEAESSASGIPWAREVLSFLRLADLAEESLTLVVPSADASGEDLEPAGFIEDVRERFAPGSFPPPIKQLDPADLGELAGAPVEARVRAMHLAMRGDASPLSGLAADRRHRKPLEDAAAALLMSRQRMGSRRFGPNDGMLRSPWARSEIGRRFRFDQRVLSPTQLESYILCPFQFFARFVLGLEARDDPDELAEDRPEQGRLIHLVLERLHRDLMASPEAIDRIEEHLDATLEQAWREAEPPHDSRFHATLALIGRGRLERLTRRYLKQFRKYRETLGKDARSTGFEVEFGRKPIALARGFNELSVGTGERAIALQGVIDRIDLIGTDRGPRFRIIDYKTGHCPSGRDVQRGEQIQLPLYALATERLGLLDAEAEFGDVGYWDVGKDGFKTIKIKDWPDFRERFESYLIAVGERMRDGAFPVAPRSDDCTSFCEYRGVCRVQLVRLTDKRWGDQPRLSPEEGK